MADSPYHIFLRCAGRYSDADLLAVFGLDTYRLTSEYGRLNRHALLADDGEWVMLADDWFYTLWHRLSVRQAIVQMAQECDVFACSVGECDLSFDFEYFLDGTLRRRYVVTSPHYDDRVVVENVGEPLPGEAAAFEAVVESALVLGLARSRGIRTDYAAEDLRVYVPPPRA